MANVFKVSEAAALALHAMVLLAGDPARPRSTREMALALRASEAHLAKVMQRLTRGRLVKPVRGPKGGFRLAAAPGGFRLLRIYEAIEGKFVCVTCLLEEAICDGAHCIMGGMVGEINRKLRDYLEKTTLAKLVEGKEGKRRRMAS